MKTPRPLALFITTLTLALAGAGAAVADEPPSCAMATIAGAPLTRAQVEADRELWLHSGLAAYAGSQAADASVAGYAIGLARYEAARQGQGQAPAAGLRRSDDADATALAGAATAKAE
ncbi:hypothetical protein GN316_07860 [Xylophilus sp. Kf1]|nr:hypothetical protein [Xylophilus sp. Kf1]